MIDHGTDNPPGMSDPDAVTEPTPPPQPPRPTGTRIGSTPQTQVEADEQYARQLAEHYGGRRAYGERTSSRGDPQLPRQKRETGLKPNELYEDGRSFLDDDLPVIKENLRKGFLETQSKVNGWVSNLMKKIDGEEDESSQGGSHQRQNNSQYGGRRSGDYHSRRSGDYNRYDADPQVLGDDFAGMHLNNDGNDFLVIEYEGDG